MLVVNDLPDAVYTRRGYALGKSTLALVLNQNDVLKAGMKRDGLTQPIYGSWVLTCARSKGAKNPSVRDCCDSYIRGLSIENTINPLHS